MAVVAFGAEAAAFCSAAEEAAVYSGVLEGRAYVFESMSAFLWWHSQLGLSPLSIAPRRHATREEAEARLLEEFGVEPGSAETVRRPRLSGPATGMLMPGEGDASLVPDALGKGARKTSLTPLQRARADPAPAKVFIPSYTSTIFVATEGDEARGAAAEATREAGQGVDAEALAFVESEAGEEEGATPTPAPRRPPPSAAAISRLRATPGDPPRASASASATDHSQLELSVAVTPSSWPSFNFSVNASGTG
jgi:hypothetical protein